MSYRQRAWVTKWDSAIYKKCTIQNPPERGGQNGPTSKQMKSTQNDVGKNVHMHTFASAIQWIEGEEQRLKNKIQFDSSWSACKCIAFVHAWRVRCTCMNFPFHQLKMSRKFSINFLLGFRAKKEVIYLVSPLQFPMQTTKGVWSEKLPSIAVILKSFSIFMNYCDQIKSPREYVLTILFLLNYSISEI